MAKVIRQGPPVQFRSADLEQQLTGRGEPNHVAKRDLSRYYAVLAAERRQMKFTAAEALLICEVNRELTEDQDTIRIWVNVADAEELADEMHVDLDGLAGRLRGMTPTQILAIRDAVERFWQRPYKDRNLRLVEVGLMDPRALRLMQASANQLAAHKAFRIAEAAGKDVEARRKALADADRELEEAEEAMGVRK